MQYIDNGSTRYDGNEYIERVSKSPFTQTVPIRIRSGLCSHDDFAKVINALPYA